MGAAGGTCPRARLGPEAPGTTSPHAAAVGSQRWCELPQALGRPAPGFLIWGVGAWPCRPAWGGRGAGRVACRSSAAWLTEGGSSAV